MLESKSSLADIHVAVKSVQYRLKQAYLAHNHNAIESLEKDLAKLLECEEFAIQELIKDLED